MIIPGRVPEAFRLTVTLVMKNHQNGERMKKARDEHFNQSNSQVLYYQSTFKIKFMQTA